MTIETMKMALETLEKLNKDGWILADFEDDVYASMDALRAAIKQAEKQEPVAWWHDMGDVVDLNVSGHGTPLYLSPPQREWQGLTDEEANELTYASIAEIEAKLKEKNA
jgi:hypothetical protein